MKGIILAGGRGTRLYPATLAVSKQLLPIYDKPMIYYSLSILLLAGISNILIISTKQDIKKYKKLFGTGKTLGIKISYKVQKQPNGVAEAFIIGEKFIGTDNVCLILGDNLFYGNQFSDILNEIKSTNDGATIFGYPVDNPREFGVVEIDCNGNVVSIEEKPSHPKSQYIVPGLYFYNNDVIQIVKQIKPSIRNELEITSINNEYLKNKKLKIKLLNKEISWFDTGTPNNMLKASNFVATTQTKQKKIIACVEKIAWKQGFIDDIQFEMIGKKLKSTNYGKYILSIIKGGNKNE